MQPTQLKMSDGWMDTGRKKRKEEKEKKEGIRKEEKVKGSREEPKI